MSEPLYLSHPACLEHDPRSLSPGHPDTPERLRTLEAALAERGWAGYRRVQAPRLDPAMLELAHSAEHVTRIRELCEAGGGAVDPDTFVGPRSFDAALHAAGGACEMVRALLGGEAEVAFCAMRPAGHHAERRRAMGFCLFNNVALAAAAAIAQHGLSRVLVVDWDVHHGNGTAEIFARRSDVLFVSIHQSHLYPGTGCLQESGAGEGEGYTINLPVPPGAGEPLWLALLDRVVAPAARAYAPQLVLVSAGFDAHAEDPLAQCVLETDSFVQIAARMRELAQELAVPLGVVLEGGYNREVLAECVCETLPVLSGAETVALRRPATSEVEGRIVELAAAHVGRHWQL